MSDRPVDVRAAAVSSAGPRPQSVGLSAALVAGAAAGPLMLASSYVQASVRTGFDFTQHPPSALELGGAGPVQQATFVLAGLLLTVGGWGVQQRTYGRWLGRLIIVLGVCLAAAGVFRMDPAFGFPPGTPPGAGSSVSWHAAIHGVLFPVGLVALVSAAVATGRRYAQQGRSSLAWITYLAAASSIVLSLWPSLASKPDGRFLPMWIGVTVAYLWTSLLFADLLRSEGLDHD